MNREIISEIMRGVVALAVVGAFLYMAITGLPVTDGLVAILAAVVGFYFGSGATDIGARIALLR